MGICSSCMHTPEKIKSIDENECRWYDFLFKNAQPHSKNSSQVCEGRTQDSSDLQNKAKENREQSPPAKVENNRQSSLNNTVQNSSLAMNSSSSQQNGGARRLAPEGGETVNKNNAESEGSEVRKSSAIMNGVNGVLAGDKPPVTLGLEQSAAAAAPVDSVQNTSHSLGPVKIVGNSKGRERIRERMAHAGRCGGRTAYRNQRVDKLSATLYQKMKVVNTQDQRGLQTQSGNFDDKYYIGGAMGVGSTSTCYRCEEKATNHEYACKVISKKFINEKYKGLLTQFMTEIEVLQILKHPNIIFLKDVYNTPNSIHMVMELVKGGEMFDYIVQRGRLSEGEASGLIRQVASGLAYMHKMAVVHRDLKPENLLLTIQDIRAEVKIIDFGLAKVLKSSNGYKTAIFLGTKGYLAPEMLQRREYDFKVDTWALGVIMFILLFGCLPFDDDLSPINEAKAMSKFVLRFPRVGHNLSNEAKHLLRGLLVVNPSARLTADDAMKHPWLGDQTKAKKNMLESPKQLKNMEKIGSPGQSYGQGRASVAMQRKNDFKNQNRELNVTYRSRINSH